MSTEVTNPSPQVAGEPSAQSSDSPNQQSQSQQAIPQAYPYQQQAQQASSAAAAGAATSNTASQQQLQQQQQQQRSSQATPYNSAYYRNYPSTNGGYYPEQYQQYYQQSQQPGQTVGQSQYSGYYQSNALQSGANQYYKSTTTGTTGVAYDYSRYSYVQGYPIYPTANTAGSSLNAISTTTPAPIAITQTNASTVGQIQPAGTRPRVTTTMWEDEKTVCYQVEANGVSVVRRADNNMINGTKLLNVAHMTRGRRDGILKSEKIRHVVKIGSMHLKGVWIPFDRALAMAQKEKIVDVLYPLFVRDIKRVIQQGSVQNNGDAAAAATTSAITTSVAAAGTTPTSIPAVATRTTDQWSSNYREQDPLSAANSNTAPTTVPTTNTASTTAAATATPTATASTAPQYSTPTAAAAQPNGATADTQATTGTTQPATQQGYYQYPYANNYYQYSGYYQQAAPGQQATRTQGQYYYGQPGTTQATTTASTNGTATLQDGQYSTTSVDSGSKAEEKQAN
ncbi:Sok2 protein [Saccharomycopsis crataegensis]|uniref:Sok2 protein n=1 Tax=Saccharomycopsis crataegensis TaxID=43959 RepID=A0AAV5QKM6_9ASCO|nr:Sok2 protein [Saccharomycopsis crataegensis]